ncbi:ankyrin repeat domain-containing protein EMB506, chloroplastic [Rhododendron vialii]|uniref:ankyrin repeat domain-containing protein EMB506, chloroplastic n=1 Tax=Rhododendron vialii TaxID=182163 RepID=UPI00265F8578|nr:ankyrin repeat domain-containing protein EMB506, chloroplastic [Rhododendron vialii]
MASFASATVPLNQIFRISPTTTSPSCSIPSFSHSVSKSIQSLSFCRLRSVELSRVSSLPRNQGVWEAPDDGSGSDYDEDEENDLDFESDREEEEEGERISSDTASFNGDKPAAATTEQYEEDLQKEIEQLLEPEERDILKQNATPNVDRISTAKWNPLHSLALAGQIHHMDMLLENGLHIDLVDKDGLTALHTAIIGKKEPVISHILRKGANPNVADRDGASPLHYAVQVGAMQTVKLLIKYNVDLNAADKDGWTPLHIAIQSRNRDIAKVLLVNGADKTRRNKDGKTPLDLALCYGKDFKSYDLAKLLKLVPANRNM